MSSRSSARNVNSRSRRKFASCCVGFGERRGSKLNRMALRVNKDEAYDLLRRWRDNETPLRVRAELFPVVLDLECLLGRVEPPHLVVVARGRGTAEFLIENEWELRFAELKDASEAVGKSSSDEKAYRFGEVLVAVKTDGSGHNIFFMEILEEVEV